jgi:predicted flap endonuclease-1-like 5' DNA nuclease
MTSLAQNDLVIIIVALVVGLIVAFWAFRRRGASALPENKAAPENRVAPPRPSPPPPARVDGREGNGLQDEFAAATKDVAGEILGVDAHPTAHGPSGPPDNLQMLKGVGPKLAAQLNENGITRFDQLARLGENEVTMLDDRMGAFRGRIARDRLVEQACYLAEADTDGFEAKFGRLGGGA